MRKPMVFSSFVLALLVTAVACGAAEVPVGHEDAVDTRFTESLAARADRPLTEFVGRDWDLVHVFPLETATKESVEAEVGTPLDLPDYYLGKGGTLLVFKSGGEVVRALEVHSITLGPGTFDRDAHVDYDERDEYLHLLDR
ncbi:hypothetical protein JOD54_003427 [Actinokineospora baliensis]|uniref:hypothetical protein n=1 Tax=Actinokineospora baliensis TaxID=547056 RepID=UPI00195C9A24|nr:hypothetical protein [Actinokineospora baliensis]MBM7773223.1 hypothetical protein [Actinokineospora baliensis]